MPTYARPTFLFELVGIGERTDVGEHAVLASDEEDDRELEALRRVQRHEDHRTAVAVELVGVGHEGDLLEEVVDRRHLAGGPDELGEVLEPAL